jgi:RNA polymerase sigma-70 factor (ECF subfamily)
VPTAASPGSPAEARPGAPLVVQDGGGSDAELVDRVRGGEPACFELLMRRHNQSLYRLARSIVRDDGEAEDVVQDAYVRAFEHLGGFEGRSSFATWLLRIGLHEALARVRHRRRFAALDEAAPGDGDPPAPDGAAAPPSPEERASAGELRRLLTAAIDRLPETHRAVFVLRRVEGLSTAETAEALGLSEANVKVRLHRARAALRAEIDRRLGSEVERVFAFDGARCDRLVAAVTARLGL